MTARRAALLAAVIAVTATAGCGAEPGDLMLVQRSGSIPGAKVELRFTQDGRVGCARDAALRQLTSTQTIDARAVHRALAGDKRPGPATRHVRLRSGPGSVLRYHASMEAGDVAFADTSARQPAAFFELARLTRDVSKGICGNPR
jgi:hypothetical protein